MSLLGYCVRSRHLSYIQFQFIPLSYQHHSDILDTGYIILVQEWPHQGRKNLPNIVAGKFTLDQLEKGSMLLRR